MVEKTKVQSLVLDAGDLHKTRVSIYINKRSQVRGIFLGYKMLNRLERDAVLLTTFLHPNR